MKKKVPTSVKNTVIKTIKNSFYRADIVKMKAAENLTINHTALKSWDMVFEATEYLPNGKPLRRRIRTLVSQNGAGIFSVRNMVAV